MKNGKKIISYITVFLTLALLISTFAFGALATDTVENKITATTSASVKQGSTGYCYVDIASLEDISSLSVAVHYDPTKIEIISAYNSIILDSKKEMYDSVIDDTFVQFSYVFDGNGENTKTRLFYFRYRVLSDADLGNTYFDIVVNDAYNSEYVSTDIKGSRCHFNITEQAVTKTCNAYGSSSSISSVINEEFELTFGLSSSYKIASGAFVINYDPELFEFVGITSCAFLKNATVDINTELKGSVYISFVGETGKTYGDFVKVKFKTIKNTNETSRISFSSTDIYDENYDLVYCSGAKVDAKVVYDATYVGDAPDMYLSPEYSYENQQLTLTAKLAKDSHLGAGDFILKFDATNFRYSSYVQGVDAYQFTVNDKNARNGELKISYINFTDLVDEETFITIVFDTPYFCENVKGFFDIEANGLCDSLTNPIMLNLVDANIYIPTLTGHDIRQYDAKDPTCTEIGWDAYEACSYCDYNTYVEIPATGHDIAKHNEKAPTCTDIGWNAYENCSKCDYTTYVEIPANGHSYSVTVTDPTCLTQGYKLHSCTKCGNSYIDTYVDALNHNLGEWIEIKAPTCTDKGSERRDCSRCDYFETREMSATGHSYSSVITAPTCTERGYTTHTCHCGDEYIDNYTDILGHNLSAWEQTTAPTCTDKGSERRDCSRCDYFEIREIESKGHISSDWITDIDATHENNGTKHKVCTVCHAILEESIIPALSHSYTSVVNPPTCTERGYTTHTCSHCNNVYVDDYTSPLGHDFGDWSQTKAPTCTGKGSERRDCSRCDYFETREISATGHSYNAVTTAPTCTERGYTTYTCHCGDEYVDHYTNVLGHDLSDWTQTKAPTCTDKGSERRTCSRCDYFETREISATGHSYNAVTTAPTCTERGYTTHTCHCGDEYVDNYTDALNHNLGEWIETKAPTCTDKGSERRDCSRCDYFEIREISCVAHSYELKVTEPTCTERGYTSHICAVCQDTWIDTYIDELGHKIIEWQTTKAPTCTETGSESGKCIRCDYVEARTINALGHDIIPHAGKQPTATEDGWKEYETCSRCDHTTYEIIPALGTVEPEPDEPNNNEEESNILLRILKAIIKLLVSIIRFFFNAILGIEI